MTNNELRWEPCPAPAPEDRDVVTVEEFADHLRWTPGRVRNPGAVSRHVRVLHDGEWVDESTATT
jgi:hypothetical protein